MAFRVEAKIEGLAPLIQSMGRLRKGLRNKTLRSAMRKSVSVVNKAAKANLKAQGVGATGQTKRSLGVAVKVYPSGLVIGVVEPRPGFAVMIPSKRVLVKVRKHDPRMTAHLIERGTKARFNKRGAYRGAVTARPFLGPAFSANEGAIVGIFEAEIGKALDEL